MIDQLVVSRADQEEAEAETVTALRVKDFQDKEIPEARHKQAHRITEEEAEEPEPLEELEQLRQEEQD
jgi:hypothetical protein